MNKRVAFCGASGTGKSTLATFVSEHFKLPMNPVGSRSVSKAMGFDSPYDVDKAGKRALFQSRLLVEKMLWEEQQESFVTDRTTFDNLVYSMLHGVEQVPQSYLVEAVRGIQRYTHIIYCPFEAYCDPGGDAARVQDLTYHELFDYALWGMLDRHAGNFAKKQNFLVLSDEGLEDRKAQIEYLLSF